MNLNHLRRRYADPDLVLIYQSGKVGSTTLANSIPGAVNVHDLYANPLCPPGFRARHSNFYRLLGYRPDRFVRRRLLALRESTDVIVPVREPWERNVSMFFQDLPFWYAEHFDKHNATQKAEGIGLLQEIFLTTFPHDGADRWFSDEFSRLTGIPLETIKLDGGFSPVLRSNSFRCLVVDSGLLRSKPGVDRLSEFLGREVTLKNTNRGDEKWYGSVYVQFLADSDFIDRYRRQMSDSAVSRQLFGNGSF